uniref:KUP/HAK/KT family potassium transporter n=1 Tax=Enterococcus sp. TaxID=35783 RepID=UPI00289B577C
PFITLFFAAIESVFFISSATKFLHGGYVAVIMASVIIMIMLIWEWGNQIQGHVAEEVSLSAYIPQLEQLKNDDSLPLSQTNVVFMVPNLTDDHIGQQFIYSILDKRPKRAKVYWFVNVEVTDEPYTKSYEVSMADTDFIVKLKLYLGFRVPQEVNVYIRQIIQELMKDGRLPEQPQRYSLTPGRNVGDFQFVLIEEELSNATALSKWKKQIMQMKLFIKRHTISPERWFGLEYSDVVHETVPLVIGQPKESHLSERS